MTVIEWEKEAEWRQLEPSWRSIETDACPFRSWELFESKMSECAVVLEFRAQHQTVAIIPLERSSFRTYTTLCPRDFNYVSYVCDPSYVSCVAPQFTDWLIQRNVLVTLKGLRSWSVLDEVFGELILQHCQVASSSQVPVLQVTDEVMDEAYFTRQRKHHTLRRREKKLAKFGQVKLVDLQLEDFDQLIAIHQKRWQTRRDTSGVLQSSKQKWLQTIWAQGGAHFSIRCLGLRVDSEIIAFQYDFVLNDGVIGYWTGFDPDYASYAPGFLLLEKSLRYWKEEGKQWIDFSVGYEAYKEQWANRKEYTQTILCSPNRWKLNYQRYVLQHYLLQKLKASPEVVQWIRNHGKLLKWVR